MARHAASRLARVLGLTLIGGALLAGCGRHGAPAGVDASIDAAVEFYCGNGLREGDETCDGTDLGPTSCADLGYPSGIIACGPGCVPDPSGCSPSATCGDGQLDADEECDDGNAEPWDGCTGCRISEFAIHAETYASLIDLIGVGLAADGRVLIVWLECTTTLDVDNWCAPVGQRLDPIGRPEGSSFLVTSGEAPGYHPRMASAPDGSAVVIWWGYPPGERDLHRYLGRRLLPDGTQVDVTAPTWEERGLDDQASVAMAPDGTFVSAWLRQLEPSGTLAVLAQRFQAHGMADGAPIIVTSGDVTDHGDTQVAFDPSGRFLVTWMDATYALRGRWFHADGTADGPDVLLEPNPATGVLLPLLAVTSDGGLLTAWTSVSDADGYDVRVQRLDAAGEALAEAQRVNAYVEDNQELDSVVRLDAGRFLVTWTSLWQDGDADTVLARWLDDRGQPLGSERLLPRLTAGSQRRARSAASAAGQAVIAWCGSVGVNPAPTRGSVMVQRYDAQGTALGHGPFDPPPGPTTARP